MRCGRIYWLSWLSMAAGVLCVAWRIITERPGFTPGIAALWIGGQLGMLVRRELVRLSGSSDKGPPSS